MTERRLSAKARMDAALDRELSQLLRIAGHDVPLDPRDESDAAVYEADQDRRARQDLSRRLTGARLGVARGRDLGSPTLEEAAHGGADMSQAIVAHDVEDRRREHRPTRGNRPS